MREIITLQLGNLSNYTATHFWNAQESYFTYTDKEEILVDHSVHWRAGLGTDGSETFLPRTVIYDLKGGFGSLRKINTLYDVTNNGAAADYSLWSGPSKTHKEQPVSPSAYQESLDAGTEPLPLTKSSVRYWSDFSRVYYHPKSLVQLYDFELDSTIRPFEKFGMGTELFTSIDKEYDIIDRDWRPFVEECDLMQGMQLFTTLDDAWGGFASSYIEALRDEYPKACIWVWGLQSPLVDVPREKRQLRLANTAQTLHQMSAQASLTLPLAVPEYGLSPKIDIDRTSHWHVSALFAAACETALTPSRLRGSQAMSLSDMAENINTSGKQTIAKAGFSPLPADDSNDGQEEDVNLFQVGIDSGSARRTNRQERTFGQVSCYRGPTSRNSEAGDTQELKRRIVGNTVLKNCTAAMQFPLLDSYPTIFSNATDRRSISVRTTLKTDTSISAQIKTLRSQGTRLISLDEREALSSGLSEIADAYQDDWSSGSDEDDDDL